MSREQGPSSPAVGVIGLGVMGGAIARQLIAHGFSVVGYDPDAERATSLADVGGRRADTAAAAATGCPVVVLSLPSDEALTQTVDAIAPVLTPDAVVVDTSTLSVEAKLDAGRRIGRGGAAFIDGPVSGTGRQAAEGDLVMMASGPPGAVDRCREVLAAFTREVHDVGEVPNGTLFKYVANLLVAVHTVAAAEAHALAAASGLDADAVQRIIAAGVGSSRMWEIRGPMMAATQFEPPTARLDVLVKDVGLIAGHGDRSGVDTPVLDAARSIFERAAEAGLGDQDAAAVRRVYPG